MIRLTNLERSYPLSHGKLFYVPRGASDPATFVAISLLLVAFPFVACYLPARRAAKLDAVTALSRA